MTKIETSSKRQAAPGPQDSVRLSQKDLQQCPRQEIGRFALDIPSVKLEQFEEDRRLHVEWVCAMLRYWCTCQREKATAAHLHCLLCQGDRAMPTENIDFLLECDRGGRVCLMEKY